MVALSLNGSWQIQHGNGERSLQGTVPGCIHTDLMAAGHLPELWWRDTEAEHHWPWHETWVYRRSITVSEALLAHTAVLLQ